MAKRIFSLAVVACFAASTQAWAHCGKCGSGGGAHAKPHAHSHGHAHAALGQPAPDFSLKDQAGKTHKLSDHKGKIVVLEWTNHTCPFVKRHQGQQKTMQKTLAKYDGKPVVWMAIDSSNYCEEKVEGIRAWVKEQDIKYPTLLDAPGKVGHIYGAKTTPHMFVIDQKGILAYMGAPDDDAYGDKDSPRNYVVEAVDALLKGSTVAVTNTRPYGCSVKYKK